MEVVGKVIEVNNQIVIQTTIITMRNLGIR